MPLRGRLAPTPTGYLHVGHARTFAIAATRAAAAGLVLRIEDLDRDRCRPEYADAAIEDLGWLGFSWTEGPDVGGPHSPYRQSERTAWYRDAWRRLAEARLIYPSHHSRRDVEEAATAPHDELAGVAPPSANPRPAFGGPSSEEEGLGLVFPRALRPVHWEVPREPGGVAWRFRVPDGRMIEFQDALAGTVRRTAGVDFGDFVVWRRDDMAAYELAVVADDHAMEIAEVVRGEDLLTSTARQILLYEALGWPPPSWCHAPLVRDAAGRRLAKRAGSLAIRELRRRGLSPAEVLSGPPPVA